MLSAVLSKASLLELLHQHKQQIKSYGVKKLGLFGSFVKDTAQNTSDIDLLVEFEPSKKTYDNFMDLSFYLEKVLGRKVELVTPQSLSKYIGPHILRETEHVF
jgi:predicted nucleotidyltransferase